MAAPSGDRVVVEISATEWAMSLAEAWAKGHAAGRDYQGDGWNSDAHDPSEDNPYVQGWRSDA